MLTVVLFVCLFFAGCHYLLLSPVGLRGWSFIIFGSGWGVGVVGHFMEGKVIFKNIIGFGGSFSGVKALTGGSFL